MSLKERADQMVEEFAMFDDWLDKYNYIIELGKSLPPIDPKYKNPTYLISGCQSQVWVHAALENGQVIFTGDSDALITKGIAAILIRVISDNTPDEILDDDFGFIDRLGLKEHLSPTRSNGLMSMMKQMKLYAMAFKMKQG